MLEIIKAIKNGNLNYIKNLLNSDVSWLDNFLKDDNHQKIFAIHCAAKFGQLAIIELLLEKKADLLNQKDAFEQTCIHFAAYHGHLPLVKYLVEQGASLSIATNSPGSDSHGFFPIHWAVSAGHDEIVNLLIKNENANLNARVGKLEYHLIHIASLRGYTEIVEILLKKDPGLLNIIDSEGKTPVICAAVCGHKELVNYLVNMGADLTLVTNNDINSDYYGYSAIHWATDEGNKDIVELLIEEGADISTRVGKLQYHLIHIASIKGHIKIVEFLINKDPELLNITDGRGRTPVFLAAAGTHTNLVAYLILINPNKDIPKIEDKNFEKDNSFISKIAKSPKIKEIPLVQSGIQALDLMISDPALANIFLRDNRILDLIGEQYCNITDQSIDWYKPSGRRPSWFASINLRNETVSLFEPVKELGRGGNGIVRLFKTGNGEEKIAVKSLKNDKINCSKDEEFNSTKYLNREAEFNRLAYPDDKLYKTFAISYSKGKKEIYTNRYIMPYVEGKTAYEIITTINCPILLAKITLEIVKELYRIHCLGIVHGDLNYNNIMIDLDKTMTPIIRLLDFGFSYFINNNDDNANLWKPKYSDIWIAPEICTGNKEVVKPHYNQDVYALGYLLKFTLQKNTSFQELIQLFPSINKFISNSMVKNPCSRPCLNQFRDELSEELKIINESNIEIDNTITPKY